MQKKELEAVDTPANPHQQEWEIYLQEKNSGDEEIRKGAWAKLQKAIFDKAFKIRHKYLPQEWYECADKEKELEVNTKIKVDNDSHLHHVTQLFNMIDNAKLNVSQVDIKELERIGNLLIATRDNFEIKLKALKEWKNTVAVPNKYSEGE
jgi:hypothetical protein